MAGPDSAGGHGWASMAVAITGSAAIAMVLLAWPDRFGPNAIYSLCFLGVAYVATSVWLTGDSAPPQLSLLLIWSVYVPIWNPAIRTVAFFAFVALAAAAPLSYGSWDSGFAADLAGRLPLWFALGALGGYRMRQLRDETRGLEANGERATQLAYTDPLTGLANRRAFDRDLRRGIALAVREDHALTVVLADVKRFKEVNDRFGHTAGDRHLRGVAAKVEQVLRDGDGGYRWGGDEFAMLLTGTDAEGAAKVCARLDMLLADAQVGADMPIELTYGVSQFHEGMQPLEVLEKADVELIANKVSAGH